MFALSFFGKSQFNYSQNIVKKTKSKKHWPASAPGPNGLPYKLYKNAPGVLRYLWRLMRIVWQKGIIPRVWWRAGGVLIPKEEGATDISQFRPVCLLNAEGKIFFSVIAERLATYLEKNKYRKLVFLDSLVAWSIPVWSGTRSMRQTRIKQASMTSSLTWPMPLAQFPITSSGDLSIPFIFHHPSLLW